MSDEPETPDSAPAGGPTQWGLSLVAAGAALAGAIIGGRAVAMPAGGAVAVAQQMCLDTQLGGEPDPEDTETFRTAVLSFLIAAQELGVTDAG